MTLEHVKTLVSPRSQDYHERAEKRFGLRNHDKCILSHLHLPSQLVGVSIRLKYLLHLFKINCINIIYYLRATGNNLPQ